MSVQRVAADIAGDRDHRGQRRFDGQFIGPCEGICTARRQDRRYRQAEQRLRAFHERRNG